MLDAENSKRMVRTSVASLACASAAVVTAALLAGRDERSPVLVAANGGFAVAAAIFATASAEAALRSRKAGPATPAAPIDAASRAAIRNAVGRIARVAQAGTFGDRHASEHAFAMIARQAAECTALLDEA
ncbi:MAG: hypothetical protein NVSMB19_02900 [Vulcanimicrobiaceae bacterium]